MLAPAKGDVQDISFPVIVILHLTHHSSLLKELKIGSHNELLLMHNSIGIRHPTKHHYRHQMIHPFWQVIEFPIVLVGVGDYGILLTPSQADRLLQMIAIGLNLWVIIRLDDMVPALASQVDVIAKSIPLGPDFASQLVTTQPLQVVFYKANAYYIWGWLTILYRLDHNI
jgi:hypothetical protein